MTLNIKMGIFWEMGRKYTINNRSFLHDFGDLSTIKKNLDKHNPKLLLQRKTLTLSLHFLSLTRLFLACSYVYT